MMLEAAHADAAYRGHIVNTASMAGLLNPPNMAVYKAGKHAVASISETLYHDLSLVTDQIGASVLCPFFVATGISQSERNRPPDRRDADARPTTSQRIGQEMNEKPVGSGKVFASDIADFVFEAVAANRFYIYSHPRSLKSVQTRMGDAIQSRSPSDPLADKPQIVADLKKALRSPP
jgi:short-subunit dehydrogenase